jgi:peptidoglycan hydrolase CwlO-like protein
MDEAERVSLETEVQQHLARVEELLATLRDLEENIEQVIDPPRELSAQIKALRMELRGRMAAIAIGEARLGVNPF